MTAKAGLRFMTSSLLTFNRNLVIDKSKFYRLR